MVVVHFFLPFLVTHVLWVTNAERENFSPLGSPTASDAMFAAPLPWVALKLSFG